VCFVVPSGIDEPLTVSGGNVYDRHVRDGLAAAGWDVRTVEIAEGAGRLVSVTLGGLPEGALALVDGLVAVREPDALAACASRVRVVVLAHMVAGALDDSLADRERDALRAATRVIATSGWTRSELIARGLVAADRVVVAEPGTDPAPATVVSPTGGRLLCLGVLAPHKGQDLLVDALARLRDIDGWTCVLAGSPDANPGFAAELARAIERAGLADRVTLPGVLTGAELDAAYERADLVVVPSRSESYGMVVSEALARGVPVVAADVGGISEALISPRTGVMPGVIVPPGDPWALAVVLRQWWREPARRTEITVAALSARREARPWSATTTALEDALLAAVGEAVPA
jgi:glycosyltransferase involved in cell wall biosynthesis